ncbi:type III-B CRISPR module-associated Cmr3 family protein [Haloechinothrix sp. LS1_15]|uniref:type III-B CRISPR module-associated Cmr3 family protein n=1 Tax=Haloechinothrix sp. LS1_15 TaxID=2652248 RepID=UPI00294AE726|nr:type III-B CRISPR module-associated Cmr3 family protein [Haloechinothrix sp. LS1_15]
MAHVTVELKEPVAAVRHIRSDFRQDVHEYVPGTVLRGALAAAWIRDNGPPSPEDGEFLSVFEGDGSFGPLHHRNGLSLPVPLSVKVHKYRPREDCTQLWWDEAMGEHDSVCPNCGGRLEHSKGQAMGQVELATRTRVALDEHGVARDGNLFSQNMLPAGMRLTGWLYGPAVRAVTSGTDSPGTVLLGAGRSVRGRADLTIDARHSPEPVEVDNRDGVPVVVLRLSSPGIFVDAYGLPCESPSRDELSEVLGVEVQDVRERERWTRWTEAGGWHAASGLPKPTERAVAPGSTYLVRCAEAPDENALRTLRARGIGLRRREGFGALYRAEPPRGSNGLHGAVAPLRARSQLLSGLLPRLRERSRNLRYGSQDDTEFARAMDPDVSGEEIARAFRTLLTIADVDRYMDLLMYLESPQ